MPQLIPFYFVFVYTYILLISWTTFRDINLWKDSFIQFSADIIIIAAKYLPFILLVYLLIAICVKFKYILWLLSFEFFYFTHVTMFSRYFALIVYMFIAVLSFYYGNTDSNTLYCGSAEANVNTSDTGGPSTPNDNNPTPPNDNNLTPPNNSDTNPDDNNPSSSNSSEADSYVGPRNEIELRVMSKDRTVLLEAKVGYANVESETVKVEYIVYDDGILPAEHGEIPDCGRVTIQTKGTTVEVTQGSAKIENDRGPLYENTTHPVMIDVKPGWIDANVHNQPPKFFAAGVPDFEE